MFTHFKPLNNYIFIELVEKEKTTSGGIIIPGEAQEVNQLGKVIDPGKSTQIDSNCTIFFKKYTEINIHGNKYVVREEDILGVL